MQIGLSEKEASIYLMLLRIGPSPASIIAKRVGMKRVTAYSVLDTLCERGIVTYEQSKNGRRYIPHDPECLLYGIEKQFSEVKFKMKMAKTCVNKLQNIEGISAKLRQKMIFHHGESAVKSLLMEKICGSDILHAIFFSFGTKKKSLIQSFLKSFSEKYTNNLKLCVPSKYLKFAKQHFAMNECFGTEIVSPAYGDLLMQGNRMVFIFSVNDELRALQIDDELYAKFIQEIILYQYFKKRALQIK